MSTPEIISHVKNVDGDLWEVTGTEDDTHIVAFDDGDGWMCTCSDHYYRHRFCKHMRVCAESESITSTTLFVEAV